MKVSYYPGCSLEGTAKSFNVSAQQVCCRLGIELEDVPEWVCCGSSPALKMDGLLSVSLSAHNLALMEKHHAPADVVIPCPFCFRRLLSAQEEIQEHGELKAKVRAVIESDIKGKLSIHNLLGFLWHEIGLEAIQERVRKPLKGLRVLPYYGCYLVKPANVTHFDDPENPISMDEVLHALGAEVLDWDFKTECCGAGLTLCKTEKVRELSRRIVQEAIWKEADAVAVACQLCQANLDMRQGEEPGSGIRNEFEILKSAFRTPHARFGKLPIIYFTQLMGLAFGIPPADLGLKKHLVAPLPVLKEKGFWD